MEVCVVVVLLHIVLGESKMCTNLNADQKNVHFIQIVILFAKNLVILLAKNLVILLAINLNVYLNKMTG